MNNSNANVVEYAPAPYETAPEAVTEQNTQESPKGKKNVAARVFAALFAVVGIAVAFLLSVKILVGSAPQSMKLFNAVKDVLKASDKAFGLPVLVTVVDIPSKIAGLALYGFVGFLAISVILGIVAVFCSKKAPAMLRAVVFFFTAAWAMNAIAVYAYNYYVARSNALDYISIALAGVGALTYFILAIAKNGKKAWLNQLHALLSIAASATVLLAALRYTADFKAGLDSGLKGLVSFKIVVIAICAIAALNALIVAIRLQTKKGLALDLARYVVQFIVGVAVCYIAIMSKGAKIFLIFAIVAAAISLLQIVLCIIQNKCKKGKKEKAVKEPKAKKEKAKKENKQETVAAPVEETPVAPIPAIPAPVAAPAMAVAPVAPAPAAPAAPVAPAPAPAAVEIPSEYVVEEYAEALPYDGGPVEGVALAAEVNPTFTSMPAAPVQTAGYDFYNSKSFDPFIAVLDNKERNEFTELFILKYKGVMPEIPEYTVGGDNKEFFRKLFIYLGQYRDRIPDGLLAKIYQFTVKMK